MAVASSSMRTILVCFATITAALVAACSSDSGGQSATPVTYPDGFPVTGMTDPPGMIWYAVSPLVTGSMYTATVVGQDLSVEAAKDPDDFGAANTLCYGFADSGVNYASCSFA